MGKKDTAENVATYSVITQIETIRKLHSNLLREIANALQKRRAPTLGIFGIGGEVSPYGYFPRWFTDNVGEGNVVVLDYNPKILGMGYRYLNSQQVFDSFTPEVHLKSDSSIEELLQGGRSPPLSIVNVNPDVVIDPRTFGDRRFIFSEANFKFPLRIAEESLDAVDSTLALHHVFAYTEDVRRIFREIFRVLKPGGLFHLGEASVNMRRSEENIEKIMGVLDDVYFSDERDPECMVRIGSPRAKYRLILTEEGHFEIDNDEDVRNKLSSHYTFTVNDGKIFLPLIDPVRDADFVEAVNQYYLRNNIEKARLLGIMDPSQKPFTAKRIQDSIQQGLIEKGNAERGLVEFYSPQEFLITMLREVGFDVRSELANPNRTEAPMVNIYASK